MARFSSGVMFLLGIASSWLILGGCCGNIAQAACPGTYQDGWLANSTVNYAAAFTGTELTNVASALSNWHSHNTVSGNCSNVRFSSSAFGAYTISGTTGQNSGAPSASASTIVNLSLGVCTSATTVFYFGAVRNNGSSAYNQGAANYPGFIKKVMLHEAGHTMGLDDISSGQQTSGASVMNSYSGTNDSNNWMPSSVQSCDDRGVNSIPQYRCSVSQGGGDPSCTYVSASNSMAPNYYLYPTDGCEDGFIDNQAGCCVSAGSPIIIDIQGDGFDLTGLSNPVAFDIRGDGAMWTLTWTAPNSDDAFLALDRNGNGTIDNGTELFGNYTSQSETSWRVRNGFIALAEYDKPENGGNNDGRINSSDAVFSSLWLWQDFNHNAISERSELRRLPALNVKAIDLDYRESKRTDAFGNKFRYRSKVYDTQGASVGRWAWDVFFVKQH